MTRLGFIDDEPAFIVTFRGWFKHEFEVEIFEVEGTTTATELAEQVESRNLDMLIIDYKLDENGNDNLDGNQVVNEVRAKLPRLPLIILTSDEEDAVDHIDNGSLLRSKDELNPENIEIFKKKIINTIKSYRDEISNYKSVIKELTEKRVEEKNGLSSEEEEVLFKAYSFLNEVYPYDREYKDYLTRPGELHDLISLLEKSNQLINNLKQKV